MKFIRSLKLAQSFAALPLVVLGVRSTWPSTFCRSGLLMVCRLGGKPLGTSEPRLSFPDGVARVISWSVATLRHASPAALVSGEIALSMRPALSSLSYAHLPEPNGPALDMVPALKKIIRDT